MLNILRKSAKGLLGILLIGLLVAAFGLWGIADTFTDFSNRGIAKVGSISIERNEFRARYVGQVRQMSAQLGTPLSFAQAQAFSLHFQTLASMLASASLTQAARDMGLAISDKDIAQQILEDPTFRGAAGVFDQIAFREVLRQNGITERLFVQDQRDFGIREQMLSASLEKSIVPQTLLTHLYRYFLEKRVAKYIVLTEDMADAPPTPTQDVLQTYYDQHSQSYAQPEQRQASIITLTPEQFSQSISVSDEEIADEYENAIAEFTTPEQRAVDQLVLTSEAQIEQVRKLLATNTSFVEIVQAVGKDLDNTDLGTTSYGGGDFASRAIEDAAFALAKGGVSDIIDGPLGSVVLRVRTITAGAVQTLAEVKDELKKRVAYNHASETIIAFSESVEDARAGGSSLDDVAARFALPLEVISIDNQGRTSTGDFTTHTDLIATIFAANIGDDIDVEEKSDGSFIWVQLNSIEVLQVLPLENVRARVLTDWTNDAKASALQALARRLVKHGDWNSITRDINISDDDIFATQSITRQVSNDTLSTSAVETLFALAKGDFAWAPAGFGTDILVLQASDIITPDNDNAEAVRVIYEGEQRKFRADMLDQFIEALQGDYGVSIDDAAFTQAVREIASAQ